MEGVLTAEKLFTQNVNRTLLWEREWLQEYRACRFKFWVEAARPELIRKADIDNLINFCRLRLSDKCHGHVPNLGDCVKGCDIPLWIIVTIVVGEKETASGEVNPSLDLLIKRFFTCDVII